MKLNRSDLELKQAEENERNAKELKEEADSIMARARSLESDVNWMKEENEKELSEKKDKLQRQEKRLKKDRNELDELIEKKSEEKASVIETKLKGKYELMKDRFMAAFGYSLFYSIFVTILTGAKSPALRKEISVFFHTIGEILCEMAQPIERDIEIISSGEGTFLISMSVIFFSVILIAVVIGMIAIVIWVVYYILTEFADEVSGIVVLVSFGTFVFLADVIAPLLPVNLLLLFLLILIAYVMLRAFINNSNEEERIAFWLVFLVVAAGIIFVIALVKSWTQ